MICGVIIGKSNILFYILHPVIDFFRPLPSSAIIPIATLFFGLNETTYIFIIVFGGIWPILLNTISGVRDVHPTAQESVQQLSLNSIIKLMYFIFPEAAQEIYTGMKVSLSICLILAVTAEMIVGLKSGLGKFLFEMEHAGNYKVMYFTVFIISLLGLSLNMFFRIIEKNIHV